ncbi:hypothetical protein CEXT_797211 [Caerostris extrusa]|uniref:Uncharacterized protein n=1 Tax=Caerostris extrusa TaxID=172846 RepID=A0AAV4RFP1_CAEEX|nr:hypothetical protein CEXT_797211 [Caerostris extrusa]
MEGGPDKEMQWRLQLRAEVQVAQAAGIRSRRRLQGHLHGLVPLPILLRLQVSQPHQAVTPISKPQIIFCSIERDKEKKKRLPHLSGQVIKCYRFLVLVTLAKNGHLSQVLDLATTMWLNQAEERLKIEC